MVKIPPRYGTSRIESFTGIVSLTKSNLEANDLEVPVRGFMVNAAGDVRVKMQDGSTGYLRGLNPGVVYPFAVIRVFDTGTSSGITEIIGGY